MMYAMYMSSNESHNITNARKQLAAIIDQARADHEPVYLTRRGHRVAAVIDADDLDGILALAEDMAISVPLRRPAPKCGRLDNRQSPGSRSRSISVWRDLQGCTLAVGDPPASQI